MTMKSLNDMPGLPVEELLRLYSSRELSPVEVLEAVWERIEKIDPKVHAVLATDRAGATKAAAEAERAWLGGNAGPLCGVPVTVKDTIEVAGMPTTYGSRAFIDHEAPDSEVARRLRAAGAVIVGKVNTPEFALSTYCANRIAPPTLNPADLSRTSGGSSGGSAASVAAGMVPLSIGTDSAGSIRIPASFCGIFGIKPSFDTIPVQQKWRASPTRSHLGPLSRTVAGSRLTLAALTGRDMGAVPIRDDDEALRVLRGARIGYLPDDPDYEGILSTAIEFLADLGVGLVKTSPLPEYDVPGSLRDGTWAFAGDHYCAAERLCPDFWERHKDDLTDYARPLYDAGRFASAWQYRELLDLANEYRTKVRNWFEDVDFVVTSACPEAPLQPADPAECGLGPRYPGISIWNTTGNPAAALPFGKGSGGAPMAVQIAARHNDEVRLLNICESIERLKHESPVSSSI